jgi:hypothetical protein
MGEWIYRPTFSWPPQYLEVSGQLHVPALYPRGKSPQYPVGRRLGGPQSWSGQHGELIILARNGTRTRICRAHSQSLHQLLCTDSLQLTAIINYMFWGSFGREGWSSWLWSTKGPGAGVPVRKKAIGHWSSLRTGQWRQNRRPASSWCCVGSTSVASRMSPSLLLGLSTGSCRRAGYGVHKWTILNYEEWDDDNNNNDDDLRLLLLVKD